MNLAITVSKLKKGDQSAFRELVYAYTGKLMVVAKIYTRNIEDAQDVLQDGFILIFQNINTFKLIEEAPFLAWMRKIVMNEALKKYRKKQFKMESYNLDHVEEPSIDPVSFDNFEKQDLVKEIHSLPLRYKQVVCLFALEGYSHKEIAEMLGIETSSSRATYSRAKTMLQRKMNPVKIISKEDLNKKLMPEMAEAKKKCI